MAEIKTFNPETIAKPGGQYSHVTRVKASEFLFIAGQVATDRNGALVGPGDIEAQCAQVYANIGAALKSAGAGWSSVVQFTTFIVNAQDMPKLRNFRSREFPTMFPGGVYPPNTMLIIDRLAQEQYLIEVQTIAAL
ncbi:MAG: enodribonuclease L-PSP [Betaproteobacteria bacterium RIFCSPLOWO2_12_FULL_63_13]|nr:MAG: enodribonuclease L-PSP [Betaproteobacteria bacterium RIFCSPLOWO2_02_FULL_63_19]OGA47380.1 MAG: enodribonuclease L-PSP [Betaproteobacteria bacterium RIFCSPLOWO2_12_FULL_63_13]